MVSTKINVDTRRAVRKLNRVEGEVKRLSLEVVQELSVKGKDYAKQISPYQTGRTRSLIRADVYPRKWGAEGIVSATNILKDGHSRNIPNFDLVRWMHESPKALDHIRSGDPLFIYSAREYIRRISLDVAKGKFTKVNVD